MNKTIKNLLIKLHLRNPDPVPVVIPMPPRPVHQPRVFSPAAPAPHIPRRPIPRVQSAPVKRAVNDNTTIWRNTDESDASPLGLAILLNSMPQDYDTSNTLSSDKVEFKSGGGGDFGGAGAGGSWTDDTDKYKSRDDYQSPESINTDSDRSSYRGSSSASDSYDSFSSSSSDSYSSSDSSSFSSD